jgi:hypothetical protein
MTEEVLLPCCALPLSKRRSQSARRRVASLIDQIKMCVTVCVCFCAETAPRAMIDDQIKF